jgi:hypothetical protein
MGTGVGFVGRQALSIAFVNTIRSSSSTTRKVASRCGTNFTPSLSRVTSAPH